MKLLIVIPHYNHAGTIRNVVLGCLEHTPNVLVLDDGSALSPAVQLSGLPITFVRFEKNQGKGAMILEAARFANEQGFTHILTIDADGQHRPQNIPTLIKAAQHNQTSIIIGKRKFDKKTVPFSSRFGRAFGGFWVHLQTGHPVSDIQSGLRIYPVATLLSFPLGCKRYAFEVEIVVKALWAGFGVKEIAVNVHYPKNRISHFNKLADNVRLSVLNTYLTIRSMLPIPHRQYVAHKKGQTATKRGYFEVMAENLRKPGSAAKNAFSAAWGIFCGSIALPGVRQVMLFMGAGWWDLNRLLAIGFEKFCIGPIVPALCIEAGFFLRHGHFLTEFNLTTLGRQFWQRVCEWVLGSLVVAPLLAAVTFLVVWIFGKMITRGMNGKRTRNNRKK